MNGRLGPLISLLGRLFMNRAADPSNNKRHLEEFYVAVAAEYGAEGEHVAALYAAALIERTSNVQLNISGGQIGNLNTGEQVGTITGTVHVLADRPDKQSQDLASALKHLTEAIHASADLTPEQKKENVDILATLATAAQAPPEKRQTGVIKALVSGLGTAVSVAKPLAELWQQWGPAVRLYFGLP